MTTPSTLKAWAETHRVHVRRDEDGSFHVPGRGGQVYQYSDDRLGVVIMTETVRRWRFRRRKCEGVGMTMRQGGDTEGIFLFDPDSGEQGDVAIDVADIRRKRRISEKERRRLAKMGEAHRFTSDDGGVSGPATASEGRRQDSTTEDPSNEVMAA